MASTSHRHKRPFQRPITSFFHRRDDASYTPSFHNAAPSQYAADMQTPPLPSTIQSSLLNVGMRVRKSVPEGYKTHKTLSLFSPMPPVVDTGIPIRETETPGRPTELVPFCGLLKTGGLSTAPEPSFSFDNYVPRSAGMQQEDDAIIFSPDAFLSSQESTISNVSSTSSVRQPLHPNTKSNKRRYDDSDTEPDLDEPVSPRSMYPVSHTAMPDLSRLGASAVARPIAQPRRRSGRTALQTIHGNEANMWGLGGDDWDEADFLKPVQEVEMGGT